MEPEPCCPRVEWSLIIARLKNGATDPSPDPLATPENEAVHAKYFPKYDMERVRPLGILCDLEIGMITNAWNANYEFGTSVVAWACVLATGRFRHHSDYKQDLLYIYNQLKKHGLQDCMKNPYELDNRRKVRKRRDWELYSLWICLVQESDPIRVFMQAILKADDAFGYPWVETRQDAIFLLLILQRKGFQVKGMEPTLTIKEEFLKLSHWTYSLATKMELSGMSPPGSFTDPEPHPSHLKRFRGIRMMCPSKHKEIPES